MIKFIILVTLFIILVTLAYFYLEPKVDETREGDVLLWFNGLGGKRKYIKLWKK